MTGPAYARNGRMDILATNRLGHALYHRGYAGGPPQPGPLPLP